MGGVILKLIVCPLMLYIANFLFDSVIFASLFQIILVGLVLAFASHIMEVMLLRRGTFWISTGMDFIAALAIIYFSQFFIAGVRITLFGAVLTAFLLAVTEYFLHFYLLKSKKTRKTE
jgi:hypothetical protein